MSQVGLEPSLIFLISNLREMDWLTADIEDLSRDHNLVVVNFVAKGPLNITNIPNRKVTVINLDFNNPGDLFLVIPKVIKVFLKYRPIVVLSHGYFSSLATVVAGRITRISKIVTVRHHGRGHHNNLLLKLGDQLISRLSHKLIAISDLTKRIHLQEGVPLDKITLIPNAIDLAKFRFNVSGSRVEFLSSLGLTESSFTVGVASRFVDWKGIEYILKAFEGFMKIKPDAKLVLANAEDGNEKLNKMIAEFPNGTVVQVRTVKDMPSFYRSIDVFIHTPIAIDAEPAGLVYLEALASGVPSIFTVSGLASEITNLDLYTWVVEYKDSVGILNSLEEISTGMVKSKIDLDLLSTYDIYKHSSNIRKFIVDIEYE